MLRTAGPVGIWLWVIAAVGQTLVALVVAQFAARIALSGSSYQWVDSAPVAVDEVAVPVVDVAADPVDDSPDDVVLDVELAELVVDDSEDVPVVSAAANPWPVATAVTSHAATAMPPYPPIFAALWTALRDGETACALDEGEANRGLTGR